MKNKTFHCTEHGKFERMVGETILGAICPVCKTAVGLYQAAKEEGWTGEQMLVGAAVGLIAYKLFSS